MKSKWLVFSLMLSLAVNAAVLATIGYHYYRNKCLVLSVPCPMSPGDNHLYQSLDLSKDQLSKMEPVAQKFHSRLAELGSAMERKRELLVDLLAKGGDSAVVESLRKEMSGIQDEVQKEVIAHIEEIKRILNPNQQQRFFSLMRQTMIQAKNSGLPTIASGGK
jgi:Spy/CpxP family protein refolding chaperone